MPQNPLKTSLTLQRLCVWSLGYAARRWPALGAVVATNLVRIGLDVLKPWPMVFLVDYVLRGNTMPAAVSSLVNALPGSHSPLSLAGWSVGATVLIFLLGWLAGVAATYAGINLGQRMTYELAGDLFARLQQLSLHFHSRKSVGDSIRRVTGDCGCASVIVKEALLPLASSCVSLVAMFCILWRIDSSLTLLALAVVPYMLWVFRRYTQPMLQLSYEQQEVEGQIYNAIEQVFSAVPVVQAFGRERLNDQWFGRLNRSSLAATLRLTGVQLRFKLLMGLATALGTAVILWLGARHALDGRLTVGAIIAFLSYLGSLYAPLEAIMYTNSTIQGAAGSARRVWEVLQTEIAVKDKPHALPVHQVTGHLRFDRVTFGYEPNRPVLKNLSLDIPAGQTLAIVGMTGAGKSTLVSLVPRFFDPWQGAVSLDDRDLRDLQLKTLRRQVSIVLQEPFLFPISIAENIAYGMPHASFGQIEAAARAANAHEFILRLPSGYHTVVGERGATLSGGERQRLSIARALLKDAPILILDEPTSALDAETEQSLLQALERLTRNRTTLIIAHRLSTIRRAHRIVVLQDGELVESGTHEELLRSNQIYARFHFLQSGGDAAAATQSL
jgi:ATP-binding cassette subfamily B protein/subfamily B ATP-binding cassette protein MsbA